jgi:acyl dehydratase
MRFAEFFEGQVIEAGPHAVEAGEIQTFAEAWDPQWFHVDAEAAAHGPFGGIIASGWHTCAIAMRLAVDRILKGSEAFASPGVASIKWPNPVRAGDSLTLKAEVLEVRRSRSQPDLGVLRWRWRLMNQVGQEVLESEATSLFRL